MEDIPNDLAPGSGDFAFDARTLDKSDAASGDILRGILNTVGRRYEEALLLVNAQGTILAATGARMIEEFNAAVGRRMTAFLPRESRPLVRGALETALEKGTSVQFQLPWMPDASTTEIWQVEVTPLVEGDEDPVLLVALRDQTAETRVQGLKSRTG